MILMAMDRAPACDAQDLMLLAIDRAAPREKDHDGHLHVASSHLTKASIRGYRGDEVPLWEELGLDKYRVYKMFCPPDELEKAVGTYNGKPLLIQHKPVNSRAHPKDLVVGTTGTNAVWNPPYIDNALSIWDGIAIDGVDREKKHELSAGYHYTADMSPGNFEGMQYDGIMRNVRCNHIALVIKGRAGPDVLVGDEIMKLNSRTALLIGGSLASLVRPLLAKDAKIDITDALGDVTGAGMADASLAMDQSIADKVLALVTPHLAQDQTLSADDIKDTINLVPIVAEDDDISEPAPEPKPKPRATPKPGDGGSSGITQAAMDAAIAEAVNATATRLTAESAAIRTAEKAVQPFVGELAAMDSAASYYEAGLKHFKVDISKLDKGSYGTTFTAIASALPKPGERQPIAQDHTIGAGKLLSIVPNLPPVKVA